MSRDDDDDWDVENPFGETTEFPLRDELELHGLPPRLVPELVASYLDEAVAHGFEVVRIIHGKGIGVQREIVRRALERCRHVAAFDDAPTDRGGWGATLVWLRASAPGGQAARDGREPH